MPRTFVLVAFALALPPIIAASVAAQGQLVAGSHVDETNGFKFDVPDKWSSVPINPDENWIVAKYISHREYTNKTGEWVQPHKPELRVLLFNEEKAKVQKEQTTDSDGDVVEVKSKGYRGYEDYLKEDMKARGEGYFVEKTAQEKVGGMGATSMLIKTTDVDRPMVFLAWQFEGPDGDQIVVQMDALLDRWDTLEASFVRTMKTFRFIPKSAAAKATVTESGRGAGRLTPWVVDAESWRKLPAGERTRVRRDIEAQRMAQLLGKVPEGWFTLESRDKSFVALSHADRKYTERVLEYAEAVRKWCDKAFGELSDEYVMTGVVRVCKNWDEYRSYLDQSFDFSSYDPNDREICDYQDKDSGSTGGGQGHLARGLLFAYLYDKDPDVYWGMPDWLGSGLASYVSSAEVRGRALQFKASTEERLFINEAERAGTLKGLRELMGDTAEKWPKDREGYYRHLSQLAQLVRFFEGPAKRQDAFKGFVVRYLRAVGDADREWEKAHANDDADKAKTEEEEERRAKERAESREQRQQFVLKKVHEAMFKDLSENDWESLEKEWRSFLTK